MDRRADLALRLQHTVEGLSVVAISYYAVSLASYVLYSVTEDLVLSKGLALALLTPVVVLAVWLRFSAKALLLLPSAARAFIAKRRPRAARTEADAEIKLS